MGTNPGKGEDTGTPGSQIRKGRQRKSLGLALYVGRGLGSCLLLEMAFYYPEVLEVLGGDPMGRPGQRRVSALPQPQPGPAAPACG